MRLRQQTAITMPFCYSYIRHLRTQTIQDRRAMLVPLDRDALHTHLRRRVLVTKRVLRLDDTPRGLAHTTGERVTHLVQMDVPHACSP